ncbi:tripartite tricarboxylate transporter substrate-binding protein [Bradyrhizobium sp.]|uniref:Bug family tripartite tricarboxylate transporter substrate binding protein n=1 Tax=Bradyrhizobium sp. TaxID=376 RepID=UPI0025BEF70C|nr:tripartite tricarboxylate transporter substrate-binding protein [Bradyrhizobium sp.]
MTSKFAITRRSFSTAVLAAAATLGLRHGARAQAYPSRPVRVILPFAAGGVADVTSRLAAEKLGDKLGQRFVVENMPGPGGIAAARAMITAAPDGYTLGLITNGTAISAALYKQFPFDLVKELMPISALGNFELVFAANAESPYKTLPELLKAARAAPGTLNIGTIAVGSTQHLGAELFRSSAKLDMQLIPYKSTPDVTIGLLRNDIHLMVDFYAAMRAGLSDGKLRALAISGPTKASFLPDVPPVADAGVPGYEVLSWNGLGAPVGTPQPIIDTLNKAIREVLAMPDVIKRYQEVGILARASSPEELRTRLAAEIKKWSEVIDSAKLPRL